MTANRLLLIAAALLAASPVAAAEDVPPTLEACSRLARDSERLGCYDREIARLTGKAPAAAPTTPAELFGANPAMQARPDAPPPTEELQEIVATVKGVTALGDGRVRVELDNGQVWQQIAAGTLPVKPGMQVRISRASLGSFLLVTPGKRSARVHRVR
jgi:hypothetical protein